jgi:hypothetical protein
VHGAAAMAFNAVTKNVRIQGSSKRTCTVNQFITDKIWMGKKHETLNGMGQPIWPNPRIVTCECVGEFPEIYIYISIYK